MGRERGWQPTELLVNRPLVSGFCPVHESCLLPGWEVTPQLGNSYRQVRKTTDFSGASQFIVSIRSALFRRPRISATSQPQSIRDPDGASKGVPHSSLLFYGRSAASGLPCAGAPPPQRPRPKTCLTHRRAFFAAVRLSGSMPAANQRRFEASLNGASGEGLVKHGTEERADGMKVVRQQSCPFTNLSSLDGWGHKKR